MSALHLKREAEGMTDWHINVNLSLTSPLVHCFPGTQNKIELGRDGAAKELFNFKKEFTYWFMLERTFEVSPYFKVN